MSDLPPGALSIYAHAAVDIVTGSRATFETLPGLIRLLGPVVTDFDANYPDWETQAQEEIRQILSTRDPG